LSPTATAGLKKQTKAPYKEKIMNLRIKSIPEAGFTTRTGRKVYGQDDYDRDKKIVYSITVVVLFAGLVMAVGGAL
jgi:hypothetical protein